MKYTKGYNVYLNASTSGFNQTLKRRPMRNYRRILIWLGYHGYRHYVRERNIIAAMAGMGV